MKHGVRSVGHPVDVATGTVYLRSEDVSLPGRIALTWDRHYSTSLVNEPPTPLGRGWTNRFFCTLTWTGEGAEFTTPDGGIEFFADADARLNRGEVVRNVGTGHELVRRGDAFVVTHWDVETGDIERYVFGRGPGRGALAAIEDVTGQTLELVRDRGGRLAEVRQLLERRRLVLDYAADNALASVALELPTGARGAIARYEIDQNGQLRAVSDALGHADLYDYDAAGRLTREVAKDGGVFVFRYDAKGRCVSTSGLDGFDAKTFRYFDLIRWTEVTDSYGQSTRFQWLPSGQVAVEIDAQGGRTETRFDEYGRIVGLTDAVGGTVTYEYDRHGNRGKLINPLGQEYTFEFNVAHLPLRLIAPNGGVWTRSYDDVNRLIESTEPNGARWRVTYDDRGYPTVITNPLGAQQFQAFSEAGRHVEVVDWREARTRYRFDEWGRLVETLGPLNERTAYDYDPVGNVVRVVFPDQSTISLTYDAGRNIVALTDASGQTSTYRYGPCQRLLEERDPLGRVVRYAWGTEPDRLERVVNEVGEQYVFEYDQVGRVVSETSFDGARREISLDAAGRCLSITNGVGQVVTFVRDKMGRVVDRILASGERARFEYDVFSNVVSAINEESEVTFSRDVHGWLLAETQNGFRVEHRYNLLGNVTHTQTDADQSISYTYDVSGRLTGLTTQRGRRLHVTRELRGLNAGWSFAVGTSLRQSHDVMGRLLQQESTGVQRAYRYDPNGALMTVTDGRPASVTYHYDAAEQLLQADHGGGVVESFRHDRAGNVERKSSGSTADEVFAYATGNRLVRRGMVAYEYDGNGRLVAKEERDANQHVVRWSYTWDALDQLKVVENTAGDKWEYSYDAMGRRVAKRHGARETRFVWDGEMVLHELDGARCRATWLFEPDGFTPIATIQQDELFGVVSDQLGTPREIVSASGRVVWTARYSAWGEAETRSTAGVDCPIRFQGQWYDEETGLHYNRFRYYDPRSTRFISPDPVRLQGGINLYRYVPNPINWADPFGLNGCGDTSDKPKKRGPKTDPNAPHNKKIREVAAGITDGKVIAGGGVAPEKFIATPGGDKSGRRPDILVRRDDGSMYAINVGRTTASGQPVPREVSAMKDLNNAGIPTTFVPYDR